MLRSSIVSFLIPALLSALAQASPTIYSGELTSGNGITGIPDNAWLADGTTLSWQVTDHEDGTYTYEYQLRVPDGSKEISHLTIEVSPTFESANLLELLAGTLAGDQPGLYPNAGDPGMPAALTGLKFGDGDGDTNYDWRVAFTSDRAPMWGDFYAKDGRSGGTQVAIWNAGFTSPDFDPTGPVASGPYLNHLLVPDTHTGAVPAPAGLILGSIGAGLVSWLRRRRTL